MLPLLLVSPSPALYMVRGGGVVLSPSGPDRIHFPPPSPAQAIDGGGLEVSEADVDPR